MGYLEQFARTRSKKEKTEVLTARIPKSMYATFKRHCDDLGLSLSEAVYLLVEKEIEGLEVNTNTDEYINDDKVNDIETKRNTNVYKSDTSVVKKNTSRFTTNQWKVNNELPCPVCSSWIKATNFARHARQHELTTHDIFTDEKYKGQIDLMMAQKQVATTKD